MLIITAKNIKRVKKIIRAKIKGGISISPNETMNICCNEIINTKGKIVT